MTDIRQFLTDDHRRCDNFFADAEQAVAVGDGAAVRLAFAAYRQAMLAHFACEEEILFPAFEKATGISQGPTHVMWLEHEQMRALFAAAADFLADGRLDDYAGIADTLLIMMQQHNMKEENVLYPMCDQHLAAQRPALLDRIVAGCGAA